MEILQDRVREGERECVCVCSWIFMSTWHSCFVRTFCSRSTNFSYACDFSFWVYHISVLCLGTAYGYYFCGKSENLIQQKLLIIASNIFKRSSEMAPSPLHMAITPVVCCIFYVCVTIPSCSESFWYIAFMWWKWLACCLHSAENLNNCRSEVLLLLPEID